MIGTAPRLARPRRAAARREGLEPGFERRLVFEWLVGRLGGGLPVPGRDRRDGKTLLGVVDGWFEDLLESKSAKALVEVGPGARRTRHRDRPPATLGHLRMTCLVDALDRRARRGSTRAIHAVQSLAVPHQREEIAADAVDVGLDHGQRDRRGQDGIHGRPPRCSMARPACAASG